MSTVYSIDGRTGLAISPYTVSGIRTTWLERSDTSTQSRVVSWRGHPADAVERPDSVYGVERVMDTLRFAMTMKTRAAHEDSLVLDPGSQRPKNIRTFNTSGQI